MTSVTGVSYRSPLHEMTQSTPTCLWNDSASISELTYSMQHGGVGATCNPVIVVSGFKQEMAVWKQRLLELIEKYPTATEDELAWHIVREMSVKSAALLLPVFEKQGGRNGRLSIQTDPRLFRDTQAMVRQAEEFDRLAPNMIVKIPVTSAGIPAIEEATYRGISINATVCFTLPQCVAVAEAVERGLARREKEGKRDRRHGSCLHHHGGAPRRLAKSESRKRKHHARSRLFRVGWSGGIQEDLRALPPARLSDSSALCRLSQPHALERIYRRRCGHLASPCLAGSLQRQ